MLRIRCQQLLPFMQPFLDWTACYLRTSEAWIVEGWSRDELEERVRFACEASLQLRVEEPSSMLRIVVLIAELGPALVHDPEACAILSGPGSQVQRVDALLAHPSCLDRLRRFPVADRWRHFHPRHDLPTDD